jgi:2-C-methyl-D-erythritol 4-phosphate cytidylyltransferase
MQVIAIVPAAGGGTRLGAGVPKQYLPLLGKPILAWTIRALLAVPRIGEVIVVVPAGDEGRVAREILAPCGLSVARVVAGGAERQDSVREGLRVASGAELILVHDAARPLIGAAVVEAALAAAAETGGAVVAVPVTDTIKRADGAGCVAETPPRGHLWAAQTPQIFRADWIREAHARALADGVSATDDAMLVERLGYPVRLVPGSTENLKITTTADLMAAEQILRGRGVTW